MTPHVSTHQIIKISTRKQAYTHAVLGNPFVHLLHHHNQKQALCFALASAAIQNIIHTRLHYLTHALVTVTERRTMLYVTI